MQHEGLNNGRMARITYVNFVFLVAFPEILGGKFYQMSPPCQILGGRVPPTPPPVDKPMSIAANRIEV